MRRALRLCLVSFLASATVAPGVAEAVPLVGSLEVVPLDPSTVTERAALARMSPDRGPLYPAVLGPLRVAVDGVEPLVALGGACPTEVSFGGAVTLVNRREEAVAVRVGEAEPVEVAATSTLLIEPSGESGTLVRLEGAEWACALAWEAGPRIVATARSVGRTTWELDWGEVEGGSPGDDAGSATLSGLSLTVWLSGRRLCPAGAADAACVWPASASLEGTALTIAPLQLSAEALSRTGGEP